MRALYFACTILVMFHLSYAPPVTQDKKDEKDSEIKDDLEEYMEYSRYLKEVVQALESDPDFRERLEKADEDDVRTGKIAEQLDFVNHNVRSKLDEIKRRELERLRHLATKQYEIDNHLDVKGKVPTNEHLDHENPNTFEIEDLKKLIKKTTQDLEEADKLRKKEFKTYEMEKEFEKNQKLEKLDEKQKQEYLDNLKKEEEAKKHHQPIHHPGSKQQLEEVWEKQDHMDQQFNPKAFFMMHDVDGNGVWDADEVKALFVKELDKLYGPGGPNKDMHERAEEMERMREHVFRENDRNHDGLIDFNEFMLETQKAEFNKDEGWKTLDENQIYTHDEYSEFEKQRQAEIAYLQQHGLLDAQGRPLPGSQHALNQYFQQKQMMIQQQQMAAQHGQQGHYPAGQQGHYPASPQGQMPPGQVPQYPNQQYPQQYPPQGYPQQGYQQGQAPPQGYQQPQQNQGYQQPPQNVNQGQSPPQGYQQMPVQNQGYQQPLQNVNQGQAPPQGYQPPQGQAQAYQPPPNTNTNQQGYQQPNVNHGEAYQPPQKVNQGQGQGPPAQQAQSNQPSQAQIPAQQAQGQAPAPQSQPPQSPPANAGTNH